MICWSGGWWEGGFESCFVVGEEGGEAGEGAEGGGVEEEEVDLLGWGRWDGEGERGLEEWEVAFEVAEDEGGGALGGGGGEECVG